MFKGNETRRSPEQEPRCQRTKVRRFSAARLVDRNRGTWALWGGSCVRQDEPGCRVWRRSRCWWSSAWPEPWSPRWSQSSREVENATQNRFKLHSRLERFWVACVTEIRSSRNRCHKTSTLIVCKSVNPFTTIFFTKISFFNGPWDC